MSEKSLDKRVALVSGSGRGIGTAVAELFAREGAAVVVSDLRDDLGEQVVERIVSAGGRALYVHLDVRKRDDWDAARDLAERALGPVDVLVSNAFVVSKPAVLDVSADEWTAFLEVNLTGVFHGLQSLLPGMVERKARCCLPVAATGRCAGGRRKLLSGPRRRERVAAYSPRGPLAGTPRANDGDGSADRVQSLVAAR